MFGAANHACATWRRRAILTLAAGAGFISIGQIAQGATYTWTHADVSNNWSVAANWTKQDGTNEVPPLTPPVGEVTDLVFTGAYTANTTSTQNLAGAIEVNSMLFNASFTGSATMSVSASSTGDQFILLGAGGLVGNVPGVSGNAGTIAFPGGTNRKIILTADQIWSNTNTFGIISQRRVMEGAFKVTKAGAGTIEFQGNNANWTGGLQIDEGWIRLSASNNGIGAGTVTINTSNNTGISASGTAQVDQVIGGEVVLGGTGTHTLGGSWNFTLNSPITLLSDKNFAVSQSATFLSGVSGVGFKMVKLGGGTLNLTAASTHGGFDIRNGRLAVSADAQLGGAGASVGLGGSLTGAGSLVTGTLLVGADLTSTRNLTLLDADGGAVDIGGFAVTFGAVTGPGALGKYGPGQLTLTSVNAGTFTINEGAVKIAPNGSSTSVVKALAIAGDAVPTATLDLSDNDLVIDHDGTSPLATVTAQVIAGRAGGAWNGSGITASAAALDGSKSLGVAEASVIGAGTFSGLPIDSTAVLVKYTWKGDTNLDGQVDITDLGNLATNWQTAGPWTSGDFDFSGFVDITDLGALATNWQAGVGSPLGPDSLNDALAAVGLGGASVPEPATLGLIIFGLAGACARRARRA